ncbi:MAG: energy transducer TonB [Ignavibacteriales bacterium]|nr:energy transducer TonB [Ignavibacteriales bacterium]
MRLFLLLFMLAVSGMASASTIKKDAAVLPGEEEYLAFAEVMPEPVDGMPGIIKKVEYPRIARSAGLEGKVIALAYVNENGGVDDVKIIKGLGGGCNEEVERVVKISKFKPGMKEGKPVKVKLTLSFVFKLS